MTVLYTSHYMEEVELLCRRVAILDRGTLIACSTVDDLVARHGGEEVVVRRANLETVFLHLTGHTLRDEA